MLKGIKPKLGANYVENTDDVLQEIINEITSIACDISNRKENDQKIVSYIKQAVISEYNCRGAEGLLSRNEGSISSSFEDVIDKMRTNIIKNGVRRIR